MHDPNSYGFFNHGHGYGQLWLYITMATTFLGSISFWLGHPQLRAQQRAVLQVFVGIGRQDYVLAHPALQWLVPVGMISCQAGPKAGTEYLIWIRNGVPVDKAVVKPQGKPQGSWMQVTDTSEPSDKIMGLLFSNQ